LVEQQNRPMGYEERYSVIRRCITLLVLSCEWEVQNNGNK